MTGTLGRARDDDVPLDHRLTIHHHRIDAAFQKPFILH